MIFFCFFLYKFDIVKDKKLTKKYKMTPYWPTTGQLKCTLAIGNLVCVLPIGHLYCMTYFFIGTIKSFLNYLHKQ